MDITLNDNRVLKILPRNVRNLMLKAVTDYSRLTEIRLRINEPMILRYDGREVFMGKQGIRTADRENAYVITAEDIRETVEYMSSYSLYAYEDELRQGFITISGGHRVGLAGKVTTDAGRIKNVRYISFLNIRLSHQIKGCAKKLMPYMIKDGRVLHTLIISPPGGGKTTMLRDAVRLISDGTYGVPGRTVGVVDERSEIAACYMGAPQNDVGIRTDIMDCCPKAEGMLMLIRAMSPDVIAVDEIGSREDIDAISYVINCGCSIIATVHGNSIDDIRNKPGLRELVRERVFERYILLGPERGTGSINDIFDERGNGLAHNI